MHQKGPNPSAQFKEKFQAARSAAHAAIRELRKSAAEFVKVVRQSLGVEDS
jgi:hypothetical protein